jgi:hypothetical protein
MRGAFAVEAATHRVIFCAPRITRTAVSVLARYERKPAPLDIAFLVQEASKTCAKAATKLEIDDSSRYTTSIGREFVRIERRCGAGHPWQDGRESLDQEGKPCTSKPITRWAMHSFPRSLPRSRF